MNSSMVGWLVDSCSGDGGGNLMGEEIMENHSRKAPLFRCCCCQGHRSSPPRKK